MPCTGIVDGFAARAGSAAPVARRTIGTTVCASLRDGPNAAREPPRSHEHPQTRAAPHSGVESRASHAHPVWRGHAAQSPWARGGALVRPVGPHSVSRGDLGEDLGRLQTIDVAQRLTRASRASSAGFVCRNRFHHGLLARGGRRAGHTHYTASVGRKRGSSHSYELSV